MTYHLIAKCPTRTISTGLCQCTGNYNSVVHLRSVSAYRGNNDRPDDGTSKGTSKLITLNTDHAHNMVAAMTLLPLPYVHLLTFCKGQSWFPFTSLEWTVAKCHKIVRHPKYTPTNAQGLK